MRNLVARWMLLLPLVVIAVGCTAQPPAPPPVDVAAVTAEIEGMDQAFVAAVAARDTNALVAMYADDARFLPANGPAVAGKDAIREAWVGFLSMPGMSLSGTTGKVLVSTAGDMAISIGSYTMKAQGPKKKWLEDVGKYVTVFKKTDAGWKIVVDTFNSDIPLPGM